MSEENIELEIAKETVKEVAKDIYVDGGKPIVKPTGELVGLIPRAIKAALSPLEQWILQKEYNVAETKRLLEDKLKNTPPELIEAPAPYIAVPAMQYISYCMDKDELRDMYANLLANSMNKIVKNGVHPSFVEIIKQLCPDEAKMLKYLYDNPLVPTIGLDVQKTLNTHIVVLKSFTNIQELCNCENFYAYEKYIDNLVRLGLVIVLDEEALVDKTYYRELENHPYIIDEKQHIEKLENVSYVDFVEGHMELTEFGQSFCSVCLNVAESRIIEMD